MEFNYFLYFLMTNFLFFFFVIVISIFGMIFINILLKKSKKEWDLNPPEKFILSFGIGFSIYISFCFLIGIFRFMNFFTLYLPIIIIDIAFVCSFAIQKKFNIKKSLFLVKKKRKEIIFFSCLFIFIFCMQFLFQWNISTPRKSLLDTDPFVWVGYALDFFKEEELIAFSSTYPPGFSIFSTSCLSLLISPDFRIIYFFFKFAPICILSFYFLIIMVIIKRLFKKNYFLLLILPLILSSNYFIYRLNFYVSSNIATIMILISLIIFLTNCPLYFLSFFVSAVYLMNPLPALFYLISLLLFSLTKLLHLKKIPKPVIIKTCFKTSILFIFLLIPYILFIYSYGFNIIDIVKFYYDTSALPDSFQVVKGNNLLLINFIETIKWILQILSYWVPEDPIWRKKLFIQNQIIYSIFFCFALFGLFLSIKKNAEKQHNNLIIYCKTIVVIILFLFFLPILIPNKLIIPMFPFWMYMRTLEFFYGPILIIECFAISYIIKKTKILRINIIQNNGVYKKLTREKYLSKIVNIEKFIVVIFLISSYSYFFINSVDNVYHGVGNYHYSDNQIDSIFFIKDNIPTGSKILVPDIVYSPAGNWIYSLLNDHNTTVWEFSKPNCYNSTKSYLLQNNVKYLLIDLTLIQKTQLDLFLINFQNFEIIYQNELNIIFEIIGNLDDIHTGIFPATWSFFEEKDEIGYDIEFINHYNSNGTASASVKEKIGIHSEVLALNVNGINDYIIVYNYLGWGEFPAYFGYSGTIEFWWQTERTDQRTIFSLIGESNLLITEIEIYNNTFQYNNGSSWKNIKPALNNTWYHLSLNFECGLNNYTGLALDTFNLFIDNYKVINNSKFINSVNLLEKISISIPNNNFSFYSYFDAFGYSWDTNYEIGNNYYEILL